MTIQSDQKILKEEMLEPTSDGDAFALELTPSRPAEETNIFEELVLTPSLTDEQPESTGLVLEAGDIFKAEEITFDGEEEAIKRIAEAMSEYDKAMDQAADI